MPPKILFLDFQEQHKEHFGLLWEGKGRKITFHKKSLHLWKCWSGSKPLHCLWNQPALRGSYPIQGGSWEINCPHVFSRGLTVLSDVFACKTKCDNGTFCEGVTGMMYSSHVGVDHRSSWGKVRNLSMLSLKQNYVPSLFIPHTWYSEVHHLCAVFR